MMTLPTLSCYTVRYDYPGRSERQGSYAATRAGREMAELNARLQNGLVQIVGPAVTAEVEECWFSPITGYEYRECP